MTEPTLLRGELQGQVILALWRLGKGTVEQVRQTLPSEHRCAYTTVQTVLTRLADRGVLSRARDGRGFVYEPRISESEYLSLALDRALSGASDDARYSALAQLIGGLDSRELAKVQRLAKECRQKREK